MQPNSAECLVSSVNTARYIFTNPYIAAAFGIRIAENPQFVILLKNTRHSIIKLTESMSTQLILAFLGYDIANVPRRPSHKLRRILKNSPTCYRAVISV